MHPHRGPQPRTTRAGPAPLHRPALGERRGRACAGRLAELRRHLRDLEDQLAGAAPPSRAAEPRLGVDRQRPRVLRCDQQAYAAAAVGAGEAAHDRLHRRAAETAALPAPVDGEPAEPPAGAVARVGVDDVEADQLTGGFDADQRVCRAAPHRVQDVGQRAEEAGGLFRVELQGMDGRKLAAAEAAVGEGREAPGGSHDVLRAHERGCPVRCTGLDVRHPRRQLHARGLPGQDPWDMSQK